MNPRPLDARAIVVTRPERQAGGLAGLIEAAGGRALLYPAIAIEPVRTAHLDSLLRALGEYDLSIFISRNAAEQGLARAKELDAGRTWPAVAAVGSGTRKALEAGGLQGVMAPEGPADSEALLRLPVFEKVAGKRILIFRGIGGRELLASALRARGATVHYAECYRRTAPATDMRPLIGAWSRGEVHGVAISSGEGLKNFAGLLGDPAMDKLRATPVFVPHPRVAEAARGLGIREVIDAGSTDDEVLGALVAYFGGAG